MDTKLLTKISVTYFILTAVIVVVCCFPIENIFSKKLQANLFGVLDQTTTEDQTQKPVRDWSIQDIEIPAKAFVALETGFSQDKILFGQNDSAELPIASLTKLMTAVVVSENYDLTNVTVISEEGEAQSGKQGLFVTGEMISLENLLHSALIESSNDAAYTLAEVIGVDKFVNLMNDKAKEIGLEQTRFVDPTGLSADNYSTVNDLVKLTKYILAKYPLIFEISSLTNYRIYTPEGKLHHEPQNTDDLLKSGLSVIGGKTGNTEEAKGCLLLIVKREKSEDPLIYILLGSDDRFGEMTKLIDWVNTAYKW